MFNFIGRQCNAEEMTIFQIITQAVHLCNLQEQSLSVHSHCQFSIQPFLTIIKAALLSSHDPVALLWINLQNAAASFGLISNHLKDQEVILVQTHIVNMQAETWACNVAVRSNFVSELPICHVYTV